MSALGDSLFAEYNAKAKVKKFTTSGRIKKCPDMEIVGKLKQFVRRCYPDVELVIDDVSVNGSWLWQTKTVMFTLNSYNKQKLEFCEQAIVDAIMHYKLALLGG